MKNRIILILLLASSLLYSSCDPCTKRVNCPAFDGGLLYSWFPYAEIGKSIYFATTTGNSDTIIIEHITETESYRFETKTGYGNIEQFCDVKGTIDSKTETAHPGWARLNIIHYISNEEEHGAAYIEFTFNNYRLKINVDGDDLSEVYSQYGANKYTSTMFNILEHNGTNYNNVFVINTLDTNIAKAQKIDKFYIAKGKGIIAYRNYATQQEYWIQ